MVQEENVRGGEAGSAKRSFEKRAYLASDSTLCDFKSVVLEGFLELEKNSHHEEKRKIIIEID